MTSKTKTTQQSTQQSDPWAPAIPYLTGALGTAQGMFDRNRTLTPEQQAAAKQGADIASSRLDSPIYKGIDASAAGLLTGDYAPNVKPIAGVGVSAPRPQGGLAGMFRSAPSGAGGTQSGDAAAPHDPFPAIKAAMAGGGTGGVFSQGGGVPQVSAATVDPTAARSAMGAVDPTAALAKSLSGQVDNPQLMAMADAATRQGQRTYQDAVSDSTDALTRQVLPAIRSGAVMSGGYGGSRQGIAEGLAISDRQKTLDRGARDLGIAGTDAAANLQGTAYENAQNRMASTADSLDARAQATADANANRQQQAGMFNVGTGLDYDKLNTDIATTNNAQEMQRADMVAQQAGQGAGMFGVGGGLQQSDIQNLLTSLGYPAAWEQQQFAPYAGIISGIGGMGGQSSGTGSGTSSTSDPAGFAAKIAQAAAMAYASDERVKRDVRTVGLDDRGRRWVEFNYHWDDPDTPPRFGVMAQEVRQTDPEAVFTHPAGFLMVDYGKLVEA